jgi:hypothetical protein
MNAGVDEPEKPLIGMTGSLQATHGTSLHQMT